jgi:hypothetical protein
LFVLIGTYFFNGRKILSPPPPPPPPPPKGLLRAACPVASAKNNVPASLLDIGVYITLADF